MRGRGLQPRKMPLEQVEAFALSRSASVSISSKGASTLVRKCALSRHSSNSESTFEVGDDAAADAHLALAAGEHDGADAPR